ncbi:MAG: hypothetical protein FJ087_10535 [Deltaproteobacteria bacterium]|nr:hypothetical protein [Deltaproteobacteria bacterium]
MAKARENGTAKEHRDASGLCATCDRAAGITHVMDVDAAAANAILDG